LKQSGSGSGLFSDASASTKILPLPALPLPLQHHCLRAYLFSFQALLDRTGYSLEVTTGQRKYGGPPPDWSEDDPQPMMGSEVFVGKIPKDMFEDELVPLFEQVSNISMNHGKTNCT
jgi:hypothetical protein